MLKRGVQARNKFYLQESVRIYGEAIALLAHDDRDLRSILLSNRAQAQLKLANDRRALEDAVEALSLSGSNSKVDVGVFAHAFSKKG